jgi:hypothetical protein
MRLAWFRELPPAPSTLTDESAPCLHELGHTHEIDVYTAGNAHDFVWMHHRRPYDLCIYEFPQAHLRSFMHAYVVHYPGLISMPGERPRGFGSAAAAPVPRPRAATDGPARLGLIGKRASAPVARAVARARDLGARLDLVEDETPLADCDIALALAWPSGGESLGPALAAMAAARPVVVYEVEATAGWPALDPQTWRPRGPGTERPVVVSIDVRDEEHSLLLAIRRLADDATLRAQLGADARAWWEQHGTIEGAAREWERLIAAAVAAPQAPPATPSDGTAHLRTILDRFGLSAGW